MAIETVLLVVHKAALEDWSKRKFNGTDGPRSIALLARINNAEQRHVKVVHYELDPWEHDWNSQPRYTWEQIATQLEGLPVVVAGIQRHVCVEKVVNELEKLGLKISVDEELTLDSDYLNL